MKSTKSPLETARTHEDTFMCTRIGCKNIQTKSKPAGLFFMDTVVERMHNSWRLCFDCAIEVKNFITSEKGDAR